MSDYKVKISAKAIKVSQRPRELRDDETFIKEHDFFVMELNSTKVLEIAKFTSRKESLSGIQREHNDDRDKEIAKFLTSDSPFLPNSIILNVPLEYEEHFYDHETSILTFNVDEKSAYVIDGQHRLKAIDSKYCKGFDLDLVVSAYFGLELSTMAEIFTRINFYQKPVSKSLVYDLLDINTDPAFTKYVDAHEIVKNLNAKPGSPFYGMIKLLGVGRGVISQAAFVEALVTRYKITEILKQYSLSDKEKIIENYFTAIEAVFEDKWGSETSMISRSVGFNALTKILMKILAKNNTTNLVELKFDEYAEAIKLIDVDSEEVRHFGGLKGVNAVASKFEEQLKAKGLL